jgi:hypothetical protein
MDPHTRAIPDFTITMASAIRAATTGFYMGRDEDPITIPQSLAQNFYLSHNHSSPILRHFQRFLPDIATVAAPPSAASPITHFLQYSSPKSARDQIRQAASTRRCIVLDTAASPSLRSHLSEILIASSSYPIIAMSRSTKSHRRPNDLFLISLKQKLFLDIFPPSNLPICICGRSIDSKGSHIFHCQSISKIPCHNRIRDGIASVLGQLLHTAQLLFSPSHIEIEPTNRIPQAKFLRPFDLSFRPSHDLRNSDIAPCAFNEIGFDVTVTPPKDHLPPSRQRAVTRQSAYAADKHLREKEKKKLAREKAKDSDTGFEITGEEIIQTLLDADKVLIPIAVSPYGRWGHMFHAFLFGLPPDHKPLKFVNRRSHAFRMYNRALSDPTPLNLIARATSCWKSSEPTTPFYGHS